MIFLKNVPLLPQPGDMFASLITRCCLPTTITRGMTNANCLDNGALSYRYSEPLELPLAVSFKHLLINGLSGWSPVLEIFQYSNLIDKQIAFLLI